MSLPAPNLDDRRFQQLVDDAKRLVQQRCPEWTDHNVSDPGVTLIETFAYMVDQLIYRLNRVPDRNYVRFLDLIGVRLFPPRAARADVTFWLSAPQPEDVRITAGTECATRRTAADESIVFTVTDELVIPPVERRQVVSIDASGDVRDHGDALAAERRVEAFSSEPQPDDALLIGLDQPAAGCAVRITLDCAVEGVGVDPDDPPLVWEAYDGDTWVPCALDLDTTGGLNTAGEVVVHVPRSHAVGVVARERAGWLRCRVVAAREGQPFYGASPSIGAVDAATVGGTVPAVHAELVGEEILGLSEGVPGQTFRVRRPPVVPGDEPFAVEVAGGSGWESWVAVDTFADSDPDDRHVVLDATTGEVSFGPSVRQPDGTLRQYGAVPPKGAPVRLTGYRTGGGDVGNVTAGAIDTLKEALPYVDRITNRWPASGGVDGEELDNAKRRGPIVMRSRGRAVTAEDYEQLASDAAPEVARVRCAPAGSDGTEAGAVRVLVVPDADAVDHRLRFEQLLPPDETLERIALHLDDRRMIGARVLIEPPVYQGITVVARLRAAPRASAARLQRDGLAALYRYFNPLEGGPDGAGWPFGRPVHVGEVYSTLQRVAGVAFVEEASLFPADPVTGERGAPLDRIDLSEHALVFSYEHSVRVEA